MITIDREFRKLIAPLSEDERAQLEANIVRDGCRDPLVVWSGILLDGHNRHEICTRVGKAFRVREMILPDRLSARIWIRNNQLGRRNLTDDQRAMQVAGLVEDIAAQSRRDRAVRARAAVVSRHPTTKKPDSVDAVSPKSADKSRIRPKISKRARVSERKVKQAQTIRKRAPELAAAVTAGELSLSDAVRQTKPSVRAEKLAAAIWPEGKYGVILADPPWRPDAGVLDPTRQIENQYPTMTVAEMIALRPAIDAHAERDCVLFLWTTTQKVAEAVELLAAWNFTIKSGAVWVKNSIGMGYWFRARHELLILATRGTPMTPLEADRPDSVITEPRGRHSEKPAAVYALIERMCPRIPKLELFARGARPGWAHMTNEGRLRSA